MLIEPLVFSKIKSNSDDHIQVHDDPSFTDKVQVLLIVYLNMGSSQLKIGNLKYARVVLEHGWKMARKILGQGSFFEQKFFQKINSNFDDELHGFAKSTHISYIENQDVVIDAAPKSKYRPTSSYVTRKQPIEVNAQSRNTDYQKYTNQMADIDQTPSSKASMRVINKSNKRKIFTGDSQEKEVKASSAASEPFITKDSKQLDEDMLNAAIEKVRQETEQKYEEKMKKEKSEFEKMRNEFQKKLDEDKKQRDTYESNKIKAMKEAELRNTQEIQKMAALMKENEAKIKEEKRVLEKEKADLVKLQEQVRQSLQESKQDAIAQNQKLTNELNSIKSLLKSESSKNNQEALIEAQKRQQEKYEKELRERKLKEEQDKFELDRLAKELKDKEKLVKELKDKQELEKRKAQENNELNAKRLEYKKNDGFSGKIEEEEIKAQMIQKKSKNYNTQKSKMNDVASPIEQKNKQVPSEIEIPLDFDIDKSPPVNSAFGTYLDKVRETEELNESVDDLESKNKINNIWGTLDYSFLEQYKVFQVFPLDLKTKIIIGIEMVQVRNEPCIRLSWFNELLGNSQGRDQHLIYIEAIKQVLNLISSKDVIPNDTPLKLIRNFHEYVRLFIFSFIQYDPENNDNDEEGPIEIKISTMGVLAKEIQIKF